MASNEKLVCAYCGETHDEMHRDHVVPRSRGGPDDPSNLVMACRPCNSAKGDLLPSEWLEDVPSHVAEIEKRISRQVEVSFRKRNKRERKRPTVAKRNGLVGAYFHTFKTDEEGRAVIQRQGYVEKQIDESRFLVWWFSWVDGTPNGMAIANLDTMSSWAFYDTSEEMGLAWAKEQGSIYGRWNILRDMCDADEELS